jgi:hypothetical protein
MNKKFIAIIGALVIILLLVIARFRSSATGLKIVNKEVPCTAQDCFEGILHFVYLYDGYKEISQIGEASISPSGTYAVYTDFDGEVSRIMLYKRGSIRAKDVSRERIGIPETFVWNEQQSQVTINYWQDHPNPAYAKIPPLTIHFALK